VALTIDIVQMEELVSLVYTLIFGCVGHQYKLEVIRLGVLQERIA
jgi:hypothetical protein